MNEPLTPEQVACAFANLVNLTILAILAWMLFCDWIEDRLIDPWKERLRKQIDEFESEWERK